MLQRFLGEGHTHVFEIHDKNVLSARRSVMLSLCGLFFGPVAAGVAGGMALLYRMSLGGPGVHMGELVIASSTLLGLVFHQQWIRRGQPLTAGRLWRLGLLVHAVMVLLMLTLPAGTGLVVIKRLGLPIMLAYPLVTVLIGKVLTSQEAGMRSVLALKESETKYRTLVDNLLTGLVVHGADTSILFSNATASVLLGLSPDQMAGKTAMDPRWCFLQEDGLPMPLTDYPVNRVLPSGEGFQGQVLGISRPDRPEPVWVLCNAYPVKDDQGRCLQAVITFVDITVQKQAQANLAASEANLAITLHSIGDAVIATDTTGRITRMNPTAERLTAWSMADALGQPLTDVFRIISAETRNPSVDPVQAVLAHGEVVGLANHTLLLAKDGQEYQIADSAAPIREAAGQIVGVVLVFSDVTEEYRLAETLRESEERWKFAIEGAGDGLWDWNLQSGKAFFSQRYKSMLGFAEDEIGDSADEWTKRIHPEDAPNVLATLQPYLEGKPGAAEVEFRMQCKDGSWLWILGRGMVVQRDGIGKPLRMIGTNSDITKRKQAEERLSQSDARHSSMVANIGDVIVILDADGVNRYKSPNIEKWFGWKPEDVIGVQAIDNVHPDDRDSVREFLGALSAEQNAVGTMECRYQCKDGGYKWIEFNGANLKHDPNVQGILGNYRDITERKQAENALSEQKRIVELILEQSLAGYWDWLIQENEEYLSPTFKKMFGYEDNEMPNSPEAWQKIIFAEDLPGVFEVFKSHVESHGAIPYYSEVRYQHKDGSTVWVICTGRVIEWDEQGQPIRMIGCHINITPLKLAEEEKLKLQTQLQQSQKMESLGTLASGVAHDMNNVLGAILGLASAHIGTQPTGSPLHQALDTICKATERGGKMVKSLLSFARQSPAENNKLDMNAILKEQVA
ncbi:MAG: PAS domain S-box protein, partial [Holophaga sp.]